MLNKDSRDCLVLLLEEFLSSVCFNVKYFTLKIFSVTIFSFMVFGSFLKMFLRVLKGVYKAKNKFKGHSTVPLYIYIYIYFFFFVGTVPT